MSRFKTLMVTGFVSAALLTVSVSVVWAHGGGGFKGHTGQGLVGYGTLSSLSATNVIITTPANTSVSGTLASQATYTAHSQGAAIAGLKTGDQVAVRGSSVNGTVTVRALDYDTKAFAAASVRYTGTVSSSSSTSLTVTASNGQSVTVQLTGNTQYVVNGTKATSRPALASTQPVRVQATLMTDGTLIAQRISITTS